MKKPNIDNKNNRYYLMRHGESLANRRGLIVSAPENALSDYGLTNKGAEQTLRAALNTRLDRDTVIVSSDYKRAQETAEIMQSVIDCKNKPIFDQRLRERGFGTWELQDHSNYGVIWQNDLSSPNISKNQVETIEETLTRTLNLINQLEQQFSDKNILLVSHGDVLQILFAHHHGINPRFHRSVASINNADIRSLSKLELASSSPAA